MRTLITGGAGFIGSHATEVMLAGGHEVLVVDNLSTGKRTNVPSGSEFAQVDITTPEVERVIADFAPEALLHFAAQIDVRSSVTDPIFDAAVNVLGTARVLGAAARAGTAVVVMASTGGAIYGEQEHFPADESHTTRPESPYGLSKLCAELYCGYYARVGAMRAVALRFGNVYGPRQDPHGEAGVVAIFAGKMLHGEAPTVYGDGAQTRDYVYVDDAARAVKLAAEHASARGAFNIGSGLETDVNTLARLIANAAGYKGRIDHAEPRVGEQHRSVIDAERAHKVLAWRPEVRLADGVRDTVAWFAAQLRHAS
ncbi:MAG: NAD-dependent epimerase/dehydratase family protein [Myxococcota bacterium]